MSQRLRLWAWVGDSVQHGAGGSLVSNRQGRPAGRTRFAHRTMQPQWSEIPSPIPAARGAWFCCGVVAPPLSRGPWAPHGRVTIVRTNSSINQHGGACAVHRAQRLNGARGQWGQGLPRAARHPATANSALLSPLLSRSHKASLPVVPAAHAPPRSTHPTHLLSARPQASQHPPALCRAPRASWAGLSVERGRHHAHVLEGAAWGGPLQRLAHNRAPRRSTESGGRPGRGWPS